MPILQCHLDEYLVSPQFALKKIDLDLDEGACLAIVGKSGCGKSTLLKILAGFEKELIFALWYRGKHAKEFHSSDWRSYYRKVVYIGQNYLDALSPKLLAWDILIEPLQLLKLPIQKEAIYETLQSVGLAKEHLLKTPEELSGGQNQRLALARALLLSPEVLLCDEITSGLDLPQKVSIVKLLASLKKEKGIAIVFVTHEVLLLPYLADLVITMQDGMIVERASLDSFFMSAQKEETKILLEASLLKN